MNIGNSLLSRTQSTWLKGVFILLIVVAHNGILMGNYEGMQKIPLFDYFYSFHVYCFFFITALYNWKPLTFERFKNNVMKFYKPYTIWFVLLLTVFVGTNNEFVGFNKLLTAYFSGVEIYIDNVLGMSFLWFLPTMFTFLCLTGLYAKHNKWLNTAILTISFIIVLVTSIRGYSLYDWDKYAICGSFVALRMFGLAFICRWLLEKYSTNRLYQVLILLGLFATTILFFVFYNYNKLLTCTLHFGLIPFLVFQFVGITINHIKKFNEGIIFLGKHSLEIYLFHLIICNALIVLIKHFQIEPTFFVGCCLYVSTLALTLVINYCFAKITPRIYKFVFSKAY